MILPSALPKIGYVIGREAFTIRNNAATMNEVANDKLCAGIDTNGDDAFKIICL